MNLTLGIPVSHHGPCRLGPRSSSMIRLFKGTWVNSESRLSHSPMNQNPWKGNFFLFPFVANLPRLTQFRYWSVGNETKFFLHEKFFCVLLWRLKWPSKGSEGFKFESCWQVFPNMWFDIDFMPLHHRDRVIWHQLTTVAWQRQQVHELIQLRLTCLTKSFILDLLV